MKLSLSFGLTTAELDLRAGSIGASTTRIIVSGTAEQKQELFAVHRALHLGETIEDADDLSDEIYPQFGHHVEPFTAYWFERRTGLEITGSGEHVTNPDFPGLHVTLDGFLKELEPSRYDNRPDFDFWWTCEQPAAAVPAVYEAKWRNARQFDTFGQVETFMPQLQQAMALTKVHYAVLSTMTSDLKLCAAVVPFDRFYWAECQTRIESFRHSVTTGSPLIELPMLAAPLKRVEVVAKTVDMMTTPSANLWAAFAAAALENLPDTAEKAKAKRHDKAKDELKKLIAKDAGIAFGAGVKAKRNKAGAISFEFDEQALADARKIAADRAASNA